MAVNYNARLFGDAAVAALAIVTKVFHTIQSITIGFGQGFQPVLGYSYGAKRMERVKETIVFSLKFCTTILSVAAVLGFIFAPQIITFFRDDPLVIEIGIRAFRFQCLVTPLGPILVFTNMLFQSMGKPFRATLLAISRQGLVIPLVYLLCGVFGLTGLECTQATADTISIIICAIFLLHYFLVEFKRESA